VLHPKVAYYIATETFPVVIDGRRDMILADITGVSEDHELLTRYPGKFRREGAAATARAATRPTSVKRPAWRL
jgi:hypothetical protein